MDNRISKGTPRNNIRKEAGRKAMFILNMGRSLKEAGRRDTLSMASRTTRKPMVNTEEEEEATRRAIMEATRAASTIR